MKRWSTTVRVVLASTAAIIGVALLAAGGRDTAMFETFPFVNVPRAAVHAIDALRLEQPAVVTASAADAASALPDEGALPDLGVPLTAQQMRPSSDKERLMPENIVWLNSAPLSRAALRGKVVLVDFWTYSCINSLRNLAYVKSWALKYRHAGLVVIGVHTPEFGFEKERPNVEKAVREYQVTYPVAIDSNYQIWQAFNNEYWPADYFIDGNGRIRHHHYGEGDYGQSERVIQELLRHNGVADVSGTTVSISPHGVEAAPNWSAEQSPETYAGYRHGFEQFASLEALVRDTNAAYSAPASLSLNQWGLGGAWNVGAESAVLVAAPGKIVFRFHSRDLHLVLGPATPAKRVRFTLKLDGAAPGADHGVDSAADGSGVVAGPRLYQLVRQQGTVRDRTFEIDFLDPGVHAFVFTFG